MFSTSICYLTNGTARNRLRRTARCNSFTTIEQLGPKKRFLQVPVASTLGSHTAFQLFGVGGNRIAVDLEVLVLAVAAGANQAGSKQLLHVVRDGAL